MTTYRRHDLIFLIGKGIVSLSFDRIPLACNCVQLFMQPWQVSRWRLTGWLAGWLACWTIYERASAWKSGWQLLQTLYVPYYKNLPNILSWVWLLDLEQERLFYSNRECLEFLRVRLCSGGAEAWKSQSSYNHWSEATLILVTTLFMRWLSIASNY